MSILFAVIMFSVLIFVHEMGHFVAAKLSGVQVNEFSLFMGPAIFKKQIGETLYAIRTIPIGGYCAMEGEDADTDNPRSFQKAAWWKRLIILLAGAFMNFLLGLLIFACLYFPVEQVSDPVIVEFTDCCIFNTADGLQLGDELLEIDGKKVYVLSDISLLLAVDSDGVHDIRVLRDGEKLTFTQLPMAHTHTNENGEAYRHYGITTGMGRPAGFWDKLEYVWSITVSDVRSVVLSIGMLLRGEAGLSDMTGVVGIVDLMAETAAQSDSFRTALLNLLNFGGFIAINLAVMNLLPIPALDGGRAVCLLITTAVEAVTKKKIDPKYEGYLHGAGMVLLLVLMAVITFKDIWNLF